ncbi:MAG: hypothetical protein RL283_423 [Actinomycetota bacterium]
MTARDGNGFVHCRCGHRHWGLHGAAGLLLLRDDLAEPHALLQLRAPWTHGGGTWALPGGARDSHEDWREAAYREAAEEVGLRTHALRPAGEYVDLHGPGDADWRYVTVLAVASDDAGVHAANHETSDLAWVPIPAVAGYSLHPGLALSWPVIAPLARAALGRGAA